MKILYTVSILLLSLTISSCLKVPSTITQNTKHALPENIAKHPPIKPILVKIIRRDDGSVMLVYKSNSFYHQLIPQSRLVEINKLAQTGRLRNAKLLYGGTEFWVSYLEKQEVFVWALVNHRGPAVYVV